MMIGATMSLNPACELDKHRCTRASSPLVSEDTSEATYEEADTGIISYEHQQLYKQHTACLSNLYS